MGVLPVARIRARGVVVAVVIGAVALVAGCGGGGDGAANATSTTVPPPPSAEMTTAAADSTTTSTRPLSDDVIDVPIDRELQGRVPDLAGEVSFSDDSRYDIRRCDGLDAATLPDLQGEATFTDDGTTTQVGVYQFVDGDALVFVQDYVNSLVECGREDEVDIEELPLGDLTYRFPYDTDQADGAVLVTIDGDVVYVLYRTGTEGDVAFTNSDLVAIERSIG